MNVVSCNAPYGVGGLGWLMAAIVEEARARDDLFCYFAAAAKPNDPAGRELTLAKYRWLFRARPFRERIGWRDFLAGELFDRAVARKLNSAACFIGFSGKAQHSFVRARALKFEQLLLESPPSHVTNARRKLRMAVSRYPLEDSWLSPAHYRKTLREYAQADSITVISEYSRQTFLEAGIPAAKLRRRFLKIAPRFAPPPKLIADDTFRVVCAGRLQVSKGIPVLVEAFRRWPDKQAQLILSGGIATTGMERYLQRQAALDPRIKLRAGDPLPYFHRADVVVCPSFEEGLGLVPLEALACGVPVIVTEDTGMKEFVVSGTNGYILPTGDVDALTDQLRAMRQHPLKGKFEPPRMS
jgi:glycosyltransferase involved in cell wall biosynthesis